MLQKKCLATRDLLLGVISLLVGLAGLIGSLFLIASPIIYRTKATPQSIPKEIKLTNFSANSVSVSFITDEPTVGSIVFSLDSKMTLSSTAFDDRGENTSSTLHHLTLKNLKSATPYFFRLIAAGQQFDNEGNPYAFSTPTVPKTIPNPPFIIKGQAEKESLVYFSFPTSTSISIITDKNGQYLLTLNNALKKDLKSYYPVQKKETGFLLINDGKNSWTQEVVVEDDMTVVKGVLEKPSLTNESKPVSVTLPLPSQVKKSTTLIEQIFSLIRKIFARENA